MHTLILGFDAFDPRRFEQLSEQGRLPNLTRYVEAGGYAQLEVSNPPQTEVSWTSIATGLNPGGHGIFDFVHRDPKTYTPYVSLLPTEHNLFGAQFVPPHRARTLFEEAADQGYPATALWWPATFPARSELPVGTLPGLGTPDIQGRLGVGYEYTADSGETAVKGRKTPLEALESQGDDRYHGVLHGPARKKGQNAELPFQLQVMDEHMARLTVGDHVVELDLGEWSPILDLSFKMGFLARVGAITRIILTQIKPYVKLYFLPLQIHPQHCPWRYATPRSLINATWNGCGPFLTLGMPQDTTGLENGCITDEQFLALCDDILAARERILMAQLESFNEGVLASVFDSLDRVQHMFWRDRPDVVDAWYGKLDALVGRVTQRLAGDVKTVILSDHGFSDFDQKVHLNRWLLDHGYLQPRNGQAAGGLRDVDWSRSQAYAVGLNGLYVNLEGREGEGIVSPDERPQLLERLRDELTGWQGSDGQRIVGRAWRQDEAFVGDLKGYGPDLVVGYAPGYRASAETGMGKWAAETLEPNRDHWGADHCIDHASVPGVLFSSEGLDGYDRPSYRDIPGLTIGMTPEGKGAAPPPSVAGEDDDVLEERLKSLGYL